MAAGSTLTRAQRLALVAQAESRVLGRKAVLDLGGVHLDGGTGTDYLAWRSHPSGALVHGPGSDEVLAAASRTGRGDSALFAVLGSMLRAYCEPAVRAFVGRRGDLAASTPDGTSPVSRLLRRPNPHLGWRELLTGAKWDAIVGGDGYFLKRRSGGGNLTTNTTGAVEQLWPAPASRLEPKVFGPDDPRPSSGWIDFYAYNVGGGRVVEVPPDNVVHFRHLVRPEDPRRGIGVVTQLASEIATSAEAAALTRAVLSNLGVPGLILSPKPGAAGAPAVTIRSGDRDALRDSINARTTGDRRGSTIVMSRPVDVAAFQSNLKDLQLEHVWHHVESRISAAVGWPAILAHLSVGLDKATLNNARLLREYATESVLIPAWEGDGETLTRSLERDFGLGDEAWLGFDYGNVRSLADDQSDLWKRVGEAFGRGEITIGQHHQQLSLELPAGVDPDARVFDLEGAGAPVAGLFARDGVSVSKLGGPLLSHGEPLALPAPVDSAKAFAPVVPVGDPLDEDELLDVADADATVDAAAARLARVLAEVDPDLAALVDAEAEGPEASGSAPGSKGGDVVAVAKVDGRNSWVWDEVEQRYRWPNTGRMVPKSRVARLRERVLIDARERMRDATDRMNKGDLSLSAWQREMRRTQHEAMLAVRILAVGGRKQLTRADRAEVVGRMREQMRYLAGFSRDLHEGKLSPAQALARAELYSGAALRDAYAEGQRNRHARAGFGFKRRIVNSGRPCNTCISEADEGWVEIGRDGWVLGATDCMSRDQCEIIYSRTAGD